MIMAGNNTTSEEDEELSTDNDQDDSLNISVSSNDLNMNDEEMRLFEINHNQESQTINKVNQTITNKNDSHSYNKSNICNPGALISDFYISNMNYAMRYSVEYVQQVAKDLRTRRERQDSMNCANNSMTNRTRHMFMNQKKQSENAQERNVTAR